MTKTLTGYDVLVYVKVSKQRLMKQCHICIKNVIPERMTLNFLHIYNKSCHDYEGVMLVLCTPLKVKCYQKLKNNQDITKINYQIFFYFIFIKKKTISVSTKRFQQL